MYIATFTIGIFGLLGVFFHRLSLLRNIPLPRIQQSFAKVEKKLEQIEKAAVAFASASTGMLQRTHKSVKDPRTLLRRADAFYDSGDLETAERMYIQVLSIDPKSVDAMLRLGALYIDKSAYGKAEAFLKHALENHPGNGALQDLLNAAESRKV